MQRVAHFEESGKRQPLVVPKPNVSTAYDVIGGGHEVDDGFIAKRKA
jgi:hypothetical protein